MKGLRELNRDYKIDLPELMETFSKKQSQYLYRDIANGNYQGDLIHASNQGDEALKTMKQEFKIKYK